MSKPWARQRILKRQDIPTQEQIEIMAEGFTDIIERTLFILSYQTGGRISEITPCPYLKRVIYKKERTTDKHGNPIVRVVRNSTGSPQIDYVERLHINYPGILRKNIIFTERRQKNIMLISMQNRKNREFTRKNVPIPVDKEPNLIRMVKEYINKLSPESPIFPFKVGKARKIISKIGMNPHFLRDIRLTHMVTIYDFNAFQLAKFAGWKNAKPAERYVRLSYTDLVDKY